MLKNQWDLLSVHGMKSSPSSDLKDLNELARKNEICFNQRRFLISNAGALFVMAKLYFYYSAMNAGKSTTLLQSSYNYKERGMQTLLFAPKFDDRFGEPAIYSRIGLKQDATLFDADFNLFKSVEDQITHMENLRCVLVDEAHFLSKNQVAQLVCITKKFGIPVLCYGLRSDFLGEPFPGSQYLLAWAEEIIEIKTICHCGSKATMNMRVDASGCPVKSGAQVHIGGNESYLSVCMKHFLEEVGTIEEFAEEKENEPCLQ